MSDLRFDGFELSPEKLSLRSSGEMVPLEPRLTELLVFLVQNADRVVSKEELIENVWLGRFVGDSAISRAIYEVRRTLGDDSKNPRYVRTVHGRGYQFVGEVEAPSDVESVAAASDAPVDGSGQTVPSEEIVSSGGTGRVQPAQAPTDRFQHGTLVGLVASLVLVVLTLVTLVVLRTPRDAGGDGKDGADGAGQSPDSGSTSAMQKVEREESAETAYTRLALVPIFASDQTPDLQLIALSLTDLLYQRLQETPGLWVRAPAYGELESPSMEILAEYAKTAGAEQLLVGNLSTSDIAGMVRVELELVDFTGGHGRTTPLGPLSIKLPASGEDLAEFLLLRDAIVNRVLDVLGSAFLAPSEDPLRPTNYTGYRLFLLAHQAVLEGFCDGSGAIELLERSLEEDPEYPPAWLLLATAHINQVWACGASADHYVHARDALERAVELAPDYVSPRLVENTILIETGDVETAYARLSPYLEEHPESAPVLASRIYSLRYAGFLSEAERTLEEILRIDPFYFARGASGESPNTLLYLGDYDRFLEVLPDSGDAMHLYYRGLAEMLNGRPEAAAAILTPVFRNHPADIFARYSEALDAILEGNQDEAELIVDQIVRQRDQLEAVDGEMSFKEAQLFVLSGQDEKGMLRLQRSFEQGFFCPRCLAEDPLLKPLRGDPRFLAILERASERHLRFARRFGLEPELPE
ncbi:MAG: winged helix-turn-helix domain-containing protein [Thermoanaerobaculia bacterium]|nr:winged helix-turn-helix domain-containing protein [Thermoanaerobaculia bacterium]